MATFSFHGNLLKKQYAISLIRLEIVAIHEASCECV